MSENEIDELGPVDFLIIEFPAGKSSFTGEMADELATLVDEGIIRVLDLLVLHKDDEGVVEGLEIDDLENVDELRGLEAHVAEILAADDIVHLAEAMENGSTAGVLVWENIWAARSPRRPVGLAGSSWRAAGSRSRRSSHRSRRKKPS
jgi:hypothetical protein